MKFPLSKNETLQKIVLVEFTSDSDSIPVLEWTTDCGFVRSIEFLDACKALTLSSRLDSFGIVINTDQREICLPLYVFILSYQMSR